SGAISLHYTPEGAEGEDGQDGQTLEEVHTSSARGDQIAAARDLPDADWNYRHEFLDSVGVARGEYAYWTGTPGNLGPDRPYQIRFWRLVPAGATPGSDVGSIPWEQDPAVLAVAAAATYVDLASQEATWTSVDGKNWVPFSQTQTVSVRFYVPGLGVQFQRLQFQIERSGRRVNIRNQTVAGDDYQVRIAGQSSSHAIATVEHLPSGVRATVSGRLVSLEADSSVGLRTDRASVAVDENTNSSVRVRLTAAPDADVLVEASAPTVGLSIIGGRRLTFTPSNWGVYQAVTIRADTVTEDVSEDLTFQAFGGSNALLRVPVTVRNTSAVDGPQLLLTPTALQLREGESEQVLLRLDRDPGGTLDVRASVAGEGISLNTRSLLFSPTQWAQNRAVRVTAAQDVDDDAENALVTFQARLDGALIDTVALDVEVQDDEAGDVSTDGNIELDEDTYAVTGGNAARVGVRLTEQPAADTVIAVVAEIAAPITAITPRRLVFSPSDWENYQYVTVQTGQGSARSVAVAFSAQEEAAQTWTIGDAGTSISFHLQWNLRSHEVEAALRGTATRTWLRSVILSSGSGTRVQIRTASSATGPDSSAGPDLSEAFEESGILRVSIGNNAFEFDIAAATLDPSEPYSWAIRGNADLQAWITAYRAASAAERRSAQLTLVAPGELVGTPVTAAINVSAGAPVNPGNVGIELRATQYTVFQSSQFQIYGRLTRRPDTDVTVTASESSAAVTIPTPKANTFTADNWDTYQAWQVNAIAGGSATVNFTATGGSTGTASASVTVTAVIEIEFENGGDATNPIRLENGATANIRWRLSARPPVAITCDIAVRTSQRDNYSPRPTTIQPGDWNQYQTVTYSADQDFVSSSRKAELLTPQWEPDNSVVDHNSAYLLVHHPGTHAAASQRIALGDPGTRPVVNNDSFIQWDSLEVAIDIALRDGGRRGSDSAFLTRLVLWSSGSIDIDFSGRLNGLWIYNTGTAITISAGGQTYSRRGWGIEGRRFVTDNEWGADASGAAFFKALRSMNAQQRATAAITLRSAAYS
ncbi:MAG: hypothetical protein OXG59_13895, partial [Gammaproteobacteria bacterium]|nr:hypothetical protein [Gammaproteobacteria bacterium]